MKMERAMYSTKARLILDICVRFFHENRGATAMEYGLLAGFIAVGIVNMLYITRSSIQFPLLSVYSDIISAVQSAA
jgi:Flp pilus assembly pilin Flp